MGKYSDNLPLLSKEIFLTDGGLETTLIFHEGVDLPEFAAFVLMENQEGRKKLEDYYRMYLAIAEDHNLGFVLESPTWWASSDWGEKLNYSNEDLVRANHESIQLLKEIRDEYETEKVKIVISGCIGPRGDGYAIDCLMDEKEAEDYHYPQIKALHDAGADMISALTITYAEEAIGITRAAKSAGIPVVISFTLETDGNLPSGQSLKDTIEMVDNVTGSAPVYFMINCAHPTHFSYIFAGAEPWTRRIRAIRANASKQSHGELDAAVELDDGNPIMLGEEYGELKAKLTNLNVFGGCCGTNSRHIAEVCKVVLA